MNSRRCCSSRIRRRWAFDSYRRLVSPVATATLGFGDETVHPYVEGRASIAVNGPAALRGVKMSKSDSENSLGFSRRQALLSATAGVAPFPGSYLAAVTDFTEMVSPLAVPVTLASSQASLLRSEEHTSELQSLRHLV